MRTRGAAGAALLQPLTGVADPSDTKGPFSWPDEAETLSTADNLCHAPGAARVGNGSSCSTQTVKASRGCYQSRGLEGRIYHLWWRFGAVYKEQESWFLDISTKPAQYSDSSPAMALKPSQEPWYRHGVLEPRLWHRHSGQEDKKEARSEAGGNRSCRQEVGVETSPWWPRFLLRMGSRWGLSRVWVRRTFAFPR